MQKKSSLQKAYSTYKKRKTTKKGLLSAFRISMPEIIIRTTRLEGESITRKMVNSIFK
ncbi:MAG: hypothetical protein GW754_04505 [Candidatus Pacebacteria bacterium]|nr:hypothetical protein [Candidatus Paceibacterota bacterium]NCS86319.1 hypothetical protein [Candidatus Paceibacterota bacterium]